MMNVEKYRKEFEAIKNKIKNEVKAVEKANKKYIDKIRKKFVDKNALAKIGDIVTDNSTIITVDFVGFYQGIFGDGEPSIIYKGRELTKKLELRKDKNCGRVTQVGRFRVIK